MRTELKKPIEIANSWYYGASFLVDRFCCLGAIVDRVNIWKYSHINLELRMPRDLDEREIIALQQDLMEYENMLEDVLSIAGNLPPFPDVVWRVMSLIRKMAPLSEIESVIKYDQAISARIMRMSRSAYFGRKRRISSLQDAILALGDNRLVQVVLVASASGYFEHPMPGYHANEQSLWEHSVTTALMGEAVASFMKHKKELTIYLACLLHDIGKTILDLYIETHFHGSLRLLAQEGRKHIENERRLMGIDHQELGEIVARQWRFPREVVTAIGCHHFPDEAETDRDIAAIVYVSNRMATAMGAGNEEMDLEPEKDHVFSALGIDSKVVEELQIYVSKAVGDIRSFLTSP
jgi:putative nucleotidyltransferase with HDIG domain